MISWYFSLSSRAKESDENPIQCWPEEGAPKKPKALVELETESMMLKQQNLLV
jgi:hypothetical protein